MANVRSFLGGASISTARRIVEVRRKRPVRVYKETRLHPPVEFCIRAAAVDERRATPCERHATQSACGPSPDGYDVPRPCRLRPASTREETTRRSSDLGYLSPYMANARSFFGAAAPNCSLYCRYARVLYVVAQERRLRVRHPFTKRPSACYMRVEITANYESVFVQPVTREILLFLPLTFYRYLSQTWCALAARRL